MSGRKFTKGDSVIITGNSSRHGFGTGAKVEVAIIGVDDYLVTDSVDSWWITGDEAELAPKTTSDTKATNPKDLIGSTKLPLNLVPATLQVYAAMAFTEGATKYGAFNWRVAGVRASIYKAAHDRHMEKYWNGEDADPTTGVPHLASAIACLAIIADAKLAGKLTDDRPPKVPMSTLIDEAEATVKHLMELHKDKKPHHHTALDTQ